MNIYMHTCTHVQAKTKSVVFLGRRCETSCLQAYLLWRHISWWLLLRSKVCRFWNIFMFKDDARAWSIRHKVGVCVHRGIYLLCFIPTCTGGATEQSSMRYCSCKKKKRDGQFPQTFMIRRHDLVPWMAYGRVLSVWLKLWWQLRCTKARKQLRCEMVVLTSKRTRADSIAAPCWTLCETPSGKRCHRMAVSKLVLLHAGKKIKLKRRIRSQSNKRLYIFSRFLRLWEFLFWWNPRISCAPSKAGAPRKSWSDSHANLPSIHTESFFSKGRHIQFQMLLTLSS